MAAGAAADEPDFADFVVAHQGALLRLAHALTGDPHDAWDLVQETLARLGERWSDRRRPDVPEAWARTVMVRLNIDRIRRLRRELPALVGAGDRGERADGPVRHAGEAEGWLVEALATLTPRQRTALALRYVEDLDVRGIAERMGCSEGTVKSQLSRGTERLRDHARHHLPTVPGATRREDAVR
ncbi:RNA polymerase sigma factor [Nocardioides marmotae]|uniref:Sigma-70 family RNA polymerase sigma factor n=1 Tax=Nocardioides marmotae TaxID=2663857 RepID=A0A6I3JA49_9ACTN|nr:SigE family RNA polymerase sigma factor [Nocardioides marmotae]MCR6029845.1 sigma-70 family RNA polymerase sigma factor [Gordonia jinghuaiqii]MBC9732782.1 SigE family RNA polymerase sigma factor [Nocardioides marmotae]MTB83897.1 sigma-70 family RNA polymerase sigma factor [Nocardioides marmotae]MTB93475.1 sigma-70 family RNA polymerase sigma factor [Nocardioides marmotae]QKD99857.1 SigE family RNA polymerase sigma factor [Nocardioides marmotae]